MIDGDPFEYLTFGGTFGRVFRMFFDRFDLFMAISLVVMIPFALIFVSVVIFTLSVIFNGYDSEEFGQGPVGVVILGIEVLLFDLATVIGQGAVTHAVAMIYVGEEMTRTLGWLSCLKAAWGRKWALLGSSILVHGSLFVAMIPLVVVYFFGAYAPGFWTLSLSVISTIIFLVGASYLYSGLLLASPAIMTEGLGNSPIRAIKRSWELSTGSRCYLICAMMSLSFLVQLVYAFLNNMFGSGNFYLAVVSPVDFVVKIIPLVLYFPLFSITETVLYLNLRVGRESMNHQVLSGDLNNALSSLSQPSASTTNDSAFSHDSMSYRHVPLMDGEDDAEAALASAPPPIA